MAFFEIREISNSPTTLLRLDVIMSDSNGGECHLLFSRLSYLSSAAIKADQEHGNCLERR